MRGLRAAVRVLKDELRATPHRGEIGVPIRAGESRPKSFTEPPVGSCKPTTIRPMVDFPEPELANQPKGLAMTDVEGNLAQDMDVYAPAAGGQKRKSSRRSRASTSASIK